MAQEGNKNAEVYTEEVMLDLFGQMLSFLNTPRDVSLGKTIVKKKGYESGKMEEDRNEEKLISYKPTTILSALLHIKKDKNWLIAMNKKFKSNPFVSNLYNEIKAQAEVNVLEAAEAKIIDSRMAQLNLINNYDWVSANTKTEVTEVDAVLRNVEFEDDDS